MNDRLFIARCSLILFIVGPLLPLLALILRSRDAVAVGSLTCGALVELLALILGKVGWHHRPGKIGMIGSLVVLVFFGMLLPLLMFRSDMPH